MWMEWHAINIAPRILIPVQTVGDVFERLKAESKKNPLVISRSIPATKWIVGQLADFYKVSKQSVEKRLSELGYLKP